jgi:hypothetical protein
MEAAKLKNFIIIVLLLVNLTFGTMFLLDALTEARTVKLTKSNTIAAFQNAGIIISSKTFDAVEAPPQGGGVVTRRLAEEMMFVETFLGVEPKAEDRGGNIMYYSGTNGDALIRGDGSFEVTLPDYLTVSGGFTADVADGFLNDLNAALGVEAVRLDSENRLIYRFLRGGFEVFNQSIEFEDNDENGVVIRGNYTFGLEHPTTTAENDDDITSLFKFLRAIEAQGILCTEVTAINNGWVFTANEYVLAKAFETDSGTYLLTANELVNISV